MKLAEGALPQPLLHAPPVLHDVSAFQHGNSFDCLGSAFLWLLCSVVMSSLSWYCKYCRATAEVYKTVYKTVQRRARAKPVRC